MPPDWKPQRADEILCKVGNALSTIRFPCPVVAAGSAPPRRPKRTAPGHAETASGNLMLTSIHSDSAVRAGGISDASARARMSESTHKLDQAQSTKFATFTEPALLQPADDG